MNSAAPTPYDVVPYPGYTHAQTHPDRLATLATLLGMSPAPVARCRVLELGCGNGSNLIPMAFNLPESQFVGIDLAAQPIADGRQLSAELGLHNIRLAHGNITEVDSSWEQYDYIIAHGLYSWVPAEVRDHALRICQANLAPQGVAFVSYNTYPGSHLRDMLREMMLFHVQRCQEPDERVRQATALVRFLSSAPAAPQNDYRRFMQAQLEEILEHDPGHLYHDELADISAPVYFTQFIAHAARHQLQYLSEADYFETLDRAFSAETRQALQQLASQRLLREQYLDFLKCRRFRQTLLCHAALPLQTAPRPEVVGSFRVASPARPKGDSPPLTPQSVAHFETPKGARVETDLGLGKAALVILAEIWPRSLPFAALLEQCHQRLARAGAPEEPSEDNSLALRRFLMQLYEVGAVSFHLHAPRCAEKPGPHPTTSRLARLLARRGTTTVTAFHQVIKMEDELARHLLTILDGTRDRPALVEDLFAFLTSKNALANPAQDKSITRRELAVQLEQNLEKLCRLGLLEN